MNIIFFNTLERFWFLLSDTENHKPVVVKLDFTAENLILRGNQVKLNFSLEEPVVYRACDIFKAVESCLDR